MKRNQRKRRKNLLIIKKKIKNLSNFTLYFIICFNLWTWKPGVNYNNTRHNVGFHLADNIISHFNLDKIKEDKKKELYSVINNQKIFVLKPLTFMNLSGKAVSEIVNFYKIKLDHTCYT